MVVSAVFGLGGIGKSTLATAVIRSPQVRERFRDGVLWVSLGQAPEPSELESLLTKWIRALGDYEFRPFDLKSASARLKAILEKRAVMLVVDDAWESEHVKHFCVGGPQCRLLVTTRKPRIAHELHAVEHQLDVLSPDQAIELLAARLDRPLSAIERGLAFRLADAVGRLPLALELASARVRKSSEVAWKELLAKLEQEIADLEALEDQTKPWKKKSKEQLGLEASLQLSLRALRDESDEAFRSFVWLGVLPDDTTLAAPMMSALWDFHDTERANRLLEFLWGEALLMPAAATRVGEKKWNAYRLHDLLHDCARRLLVTPEVPTQEGELPGLGLARPEAHRQLLGRYRARTQRGLWHTLVADGYIHNRLGWHLEKAGEVEKLHALLREETAEGRNGWFEACEKVERTAAFLHDVRRAWRFVDVSVSQGDERIGLQCRYALLEASVNSRAGNLPPEFLEALVRHRRWTGVQATTSARRIPNIFQRVKSFARLVPHLSGSEREALLVEALAAIQNVKDDRGRVKALAELVPHLSEELLTVAFHHAKSIQEMYRSDALEVLVPHLPFALVREALASARNFRSAGFRGEALAAVAVRLPEPERSTVLSQALSEVRALRTSEAVNRYLSALVTKLPDELLAEALAVARGIRKKRYRCLALAAVAARLPEAQRLPVLAEGLAVARAIPSEADPGANRVVMGSRRSPTRASDGRNARCRALAALAPQLPDKERHEVFVEVLRAVGEIEEGDRSDVLVGLAPHLPPDLLTEALATARTIRSDETRSEALAKLAPHLSVPLLTEALSAARQINSDEDRVAALAALAVFLPEGERLAVLTEAVNVVRGMWLDTDRYLSLSILTPVLPATLLTESLTIAQTIGDEHACSEALAAIAAVALTSLLPERPAMLAVALAAAGAIKEEWVLYQTLLTMAPHIPPALLTDALALARTIDTVGFRSRTLAALAASLPPEEGLPLLAEVVTMTLSINSEGSRHEILAALLPYLPDQKRDEVLDELLPAARLIGTAADKRRYWGKDKMLVARCEALTALVPYLPDQKRLEVLDEILSAGRNIRDEHDRVKILSKSAMQLPPQLLLDALGEGWTIRGERDRTADLVTKLPDELLAEALAVARGIRKKRYRCLALAAVAARLPEAQRLPVLAEGLAVARAIPSEADPGANRVVMGSRRSPTRASDGRNARCRALAALAPQLPDKERHEVFVEVLRAVGEIEEGDRSDVLVGLAPHLPPDLLTEALATARTIRYQTTRLKTLTTLAAQLRGQESLPVLTEILVGARTIDVDSANSIQWARSEILAILAVPLARLSRPVLASQWTETLPLLAVSTRKALLADLSSLTPVITVLAGSNIARELHEVVQSISDVARWWP